MGFLVEEAVVSNKANFGGSFKLEVSSVKPEKPKVRTSDFTRYTRP